MVLTFSVLVLHFLKGRVARSVFPVPYCPIVKLQPWILDLDSNYFNLKLPFLKVAGSKDLLAFRWVFYLFITVFERLTPELSILFP